MQIYVSISLLNSWSYQADIILESQKYMPNYCIWLSEITKRLKKRFYLPVWENIPNIKKGFPGGLGMKYPKSLHHKNSSH